MIQGPMAERIVEAFDGMSVQLQSAARFVLQHPREVALLSMREQAKAAGVQPATMTRLAKRLGLDGYETLRRSYAEAIRGGHPGFAGLADAQARRQRLKGDAALADEILSGLAGQIGGLASEEVLPAIVAAATSIETARRVYCLGLRSSHAVAWHLHYILSLIGEKSVLLDGIAGTGLDAMGRASERDVLVAVSVQPYTRATVETVGFACERGVPVVAITDSAVSPLYQAADTVILVPTASPSFFHAMSPAFAVAEVLGALVAGHGGNDALEALRELETQLFTFKVHIKPRRVP
jgi:DNA-binding MurR/RpiR family transcriptional regulator